MLVSQAATCACVRVHVHIHVRAGAHMHKHEHGHARVQEHAPRSCGISPPPTSLQYVWRSNGRSATRRGKCAIERMKRCNASTAPDRSMW